MVVSDKRNRSAIFFRFTPVPIRATISRSRVVNLAILAPLGSRPAVDDAVARRWPNAEVTSERDSQASPA